MITKRKLAILEDSPCSTPRPASHAVTRHPKAVTLTCHSHKVCNGSHIKFKHMDPTEGGLRLVSFLKTDWRIEGELPCTWQKLKSYLSLIAMSQFYSTVCKLDMSVIMYCYCSFLSSGIILLTLQFAVFLRTLLLTLDIGESTSPSSSRCRPLVYPGWSSTGAWSAVALNADSRLSTVINIYLLDEEIDICTYRT
jgi:hypothetical protein